VGSPYLSKGWGGEVKSHEVVSCKKFGSNLADDDPRMVAIATGNLPFSTRRR